MINLLKSLFKRSKPIKAKCQWCEHDLEWSREAGMYRSQQNANFFCPQDPSSERAMHWPEVQE